MTDDNVLMETDSESKEDIYVEESEETIRRHMSDVMCQVSRHRGGARRWRVCYQQGLLRLVV